MLSSSNKLLQCLLLSFDRQFIDFPIRLIEIEKIKLIIICQFFLIILFSNIMHFLIEAHSEKYLKINARLNLYAFISTFSQKESNRVRHCQ